jgi:hypothetical protein
MSQYFVRVLRGCSQICRRNAPTFNKLGLLAKGGIDFFKLIID